MDVVARKDVVLRSEPTERQSKAENESTMSGTIWLILSQYEEDLQPQFASVWNKMQADPQSGFPQLVAPVVAVRPLVSWPEPPASALS
jgi:hypothetical protein